jgi:hypothetical protein
MLTTAHFTLADAPGTAAIFLLGVGVGLALLAGRIVWAPLTGLFAFATMGAIADAEGWSAGVSLTIDLIAMLFAVTCLALLARPALRSRRIT